MIIIFVAITASLVLSSVSNAIDCKTCTSGVPEANQCATPSDWRVESNCVACGILSFQFRDNNNEYRRGGNGQWDKLGLRSAVQQQQQQNGGDRFGQTQPIDNNRHQIAGQNGGYGGEASSFYTQSNQNNFGTYNQPSSYSPNDQINNFNGNTNDDLVCTDNAELIKQFQVDAVNGLEHEQYEQEQQPQRAYQTDEYRVGLFRTFTFPDLLRYTQMCVCFGDRCTDQFQPGQALPVSQYNAGERQFQQQQQNGFGAGYNNNNNGQQNSQLNFPSGRLARQPSSLRVLPNTLPMRFADEEVREAPLITTSNSSRTITTAKTLK